MTFTVTVAYENGNEVELDSIAGVHHNEYKSARREGTAIDITSATAVDENGKITKTKIERLVVPEGRGVNELDSAFTRVLYYPSGGSNTTDGWVVIIH